MKPKTLALRNKIARHLNGWEQLGCKVFTGNRFFNRKWNRTARDTVDIYLSRLIVGCSSKGKMIVICPMAKRYEVPEILAKFLTDFHSRGAIVGCARNIGDAWDIVADSPQYKRKRVTYSFISKRRKDDGEE